MKNRPLYLDDELFQCYVHNPLVKQNRFIKMDPDRRAVPTFGESRQLLPEPHWDGHAADIDCYWKAWELAFANLGTPTAGNEFVAPYIDTCFNGHLFLWDSVFILMFGRYGSRAFDFQRTLDNLYAKQHPDGFICREVDIAHGQDCFHRHDPASTGPNTLAWSEWEYYLNFGDKDRLARVYPVLMAYHQWMRDYRTWPDGTYWSCGWANGMDNQPRVPAGYSAPHSPAHMAWVDACFQAMLSARLLTRIGEELATVLPLQPLHDEVALLAKVTNDTMWDERAAYYFDRRRDGSLNGVKSVGCYWGLLADAVPAERLERFIAHLDDPREFNRPHRVPSLSADTPQYAPHGDYWNGGVWPSTQYMILRGLTHVGRDQLAHEIGLNHVSNVTEVFRQTGTLWENYAPESAAPGDPARPDFVGWGGLAPITVLLEYVFGLRPDVPNRRLVWDVRRLESHGVDRYPFGPAGQLSLRCAARERPSERPQVTISGNTPVDLDLRWSGGRDIIAVAGH
jgi:hypothetical protein